MDEAPEDDEARQTYNFPPGAYGLVYRADIPDHGVRDAEAGDSSGGGNDSEVGVSSDDRAEHHETVEGEAPSDKPHSYNYQIKVMKWGLIPFWTKRSPDYGSMMRTINCRDDSLIENRGMWNTMKQRKRCIVVAQGFYEWLKKGPNGKERIPHFVKRKDGNLMCFAGLWDCVKYEDAEEKLYTYTIITTDSNKHLRFLHDRMPVILETDEIKMWLDPKRNKWSKELQALLKPFQGELECYPVDTAVGKVGNDSPSFIVPVDSKENKKNIANFFGNAKKQNDKKASNAKVGTDPDENRGTVDESIGENNAPLPASSSLEKANPGQKRSHDDEAEASPAKKHTKLSSPLNNTVSPSKPAATSGKNREVQQATRT